jgi:hypothetical protein
MRQFRMGRENVEDRRRSGDAAEDRQISKLISESMEHSKHRSMLQFETLLKLPALLGQWCPMPSFKFFIWNFVIGDRSRQIE